MVSNSNNTLTFKCEPNLLTINAMVNLVVVFTATFLIGKIGTWKVREHLRTEWTLETTSTEDRYHWFITSISLIIYTVA